MLQIDQYKTRSRLIKGNIIIVHHMKVLWSVWIDCTYRGGLNCRVNQMKLNVFRAMARLVQMGTSLHLLEKITKKSTFWIILASCCINIIATELFLYENLNLSYDHSIEIVLPWNKLYKFERILRFKRWILRFFICLRIVPDKKCNFISLIQTFN